MRHYGMNTINALRCLPAFVIVLSGLSGCGGRTYPALDAVEIRRTEGDIPHIKAADWFGAGYGHGYVQAEDALCTLAEAFVTYRGERSVYWGPHAKPDHDATFGRADNLQLDVFFRAFVDEARIKRYRARQSRQIDRLVQGFAAGYNRYVATTGAAGRACAGQPWLQIVSPNDVYRRLYAVGLAAGYARFIPQIVSARPPTERVSAVSSPPETGKQARAALLHRFASTVGSRPHLGSNALAFGGRVAGDGQSVLFGNPHWYWSGPDRFYRAHLTIPGRVNVAGAAILGVPVIMIGFNDQVAWSHTVSTARRYGLFELTLSPDNPTAYQYDGESVPMRAQVVAVQVRDEQGGITSVSRTLYRSHHGPIVDFGAAAAALGWSKTRAWAIRDINADNVDVFATFVRWSQARSLDEFIAIQKDTSAIPWVNTVAIGRDDGRAWFADIGRVPDVSDARRARCAGEAAPVFSRLDALAPLLDGSRSECDWPSQAMPPERMPSLLSRKFVANMNDSYWLTQPAAPIEGLDRILGREGRPLSLRSQAGFRLANEFSRREWASAHDLNRALQPAVLDAEAYSAVRFKDALLSAVCVAETVSVHDDILTGAAFAAPRTVAIDRACRVLAQWSGGGNADDRGSLLWDSWWQRLRRIPPAEFYRKPFSATQPLVTPAEPNGRHPRVAEALGAALLSMQAQGLALGTPRGDVLSVTVEGQALGLYGGCSSQGYFTIACAAEDVYDMSSLGFGNSYLQMVSFGDDGLRAYTLMAHGQREHALNGGPGGEPVRRYADKQWRRMPFSAAEIADAPAVSRRVLRFRNPSSAR